MIFTHAKKLLMAVVCLLAATAAQAQYSGTATQYPTSDYSNTPVEFKLSEVAATLDTDASTLGAAISEYIKAESLTTYLFYLQQPDGTEATDGEADKHGYWMSADGTNLPYGEGCAFFACPDLDADNDVFMFRLGQMPNVLEAGQECKANIKLKFNNKEASFALTLSVVEKPTYDVPEPASLLLKDLNVVANLTVDVEQRPFTNWGSSTVEVDLTDAIAKLGITDAGLVENALEQLVYAPQLYTPDDVALGTMKNDTLSNTFTAGGIGFWTCPYEGQDESESIECVSKAYDANDYFYVENLSFDASTGKLSAGVGQMPNKLEGGMQLYTYIYLLYGDKAICIRYNLNVIKVELGTIEDYTKAGEIVVEVEQEPTSHYETKTVKPDLEAIAEALGVDVDQMDLLALKNEIEFSTGGTANNGGWWFNADGFVTSWGSSATMFIEPRSEGDYSALNVGQYPDVFNIGDEQSQSIYFLGTDKYYQYTVHLTVVEPKVIDDEFHSVAQRSFTAQQLPAGDYVWDSDIDIPYEFIESYVGSEYVVYGMALLDDEGNEREGNAKYTNSYNLNSNENPGFWLNAEGRSCGWGSNARFAVSAAAHDGKFCLMQYPNTTSVGDVYKTKLFFVNEETSEMVTINFTLNIVDEIVEYDVVGSEDITIPVSMDDVTISIDLSKAAEALGVTVDDLMKSDDCLRGINEGGLYGAGASAADGLGFNSYGFLDMVEGIVFFSIEKNGSEVELTAWAEEEIDNDFRLSAQFCFQVDDKQYVFYATFVSEETYNGISTLATDGAASGRIYDLSGRQVMQPQRGIYIKDGRKVVVK